MDSSFTERPSWSQPLPDLVSDEFAELYQNHSREIYYLTLRFLGDPQKAEDATHDVFLKAFRRLGSLSRRSFIRTWLYRIAINHCQNLCQSWPNRHMPGQFRGSRLGNFRRPRPIRPLRVFETKELGQRIQKTLDALVRRIPAAAAARRRRGVELRGNRRARRPVRRCRARKIAPRPQSLCRAF